jgi:hypothetical protein
LIGIFPVVSSFAHNVHETPPRDLAGPIVLVLAATLVLQLAARRLVRDPLRAGLLVSLLLVLFFTANVCTEFVNDCLFFLSTFWVTTIFQLPPARVVTVEVAFVVVLGYLAVARLRSPRALTSFLNVFALILVGLPASSAVVALAREPAPRAMRGVAMKTAPRPTRLPDIYYIVLDGMARADVLETIFAYDQHPFLDRLERRGFVVARRASANYCQTPLSLASSLNGAYLDPLAGESFSDLTKLSELIGDNTVIKTLRPHGYRFVTFASGFDETEHPEADSYLSPYPHIRGFHRLLLSRTPLWICLPNPMEYDSYTMTRQRTLYLFDHLPEIARRREPTFTLAHILGPHPPFVFGEHGEDVSRHEIQYYLTDGSLFYLRYGNTNDYIRGYRAEAAYLSARIERVIDRILEESPEPPIILLQSDHGSGSRLQLESVERTDLWERMSILSAYYLPGRGPAGLYETITPVNSFRIVLNAYFGTDLALLADRNYFSKWSSPYDFIDVTDRVRPPGDSPEGNP